MAKPTPVVPVSNLRIRVRTRAGRPLAQQPVTLDAPPLTAKTDGAGFVQFGLTQDQLDALDPKGQVVIHTKLRHNGPDPGPGNKVVPGEAKVTATAVKGGFDPATPGLATDRKGTFLDIVLVDAAFNFGAATPATIARRLTDPEVQSELSFLQANGDVALTPDSEFQFNHDPSSGEFDPCDPTKCTLKSPAANKRVNVQKATFGPVKFFALMNFFPSAANAKTDQIPGQRFTRDRFQWDNMSAGLLDQRHVVGLTRLCKSINGSHSVVAIYTQGISGDTTGTHTHNYGLACDFGGCSTTLPDPATKTMPVRLGTDFIVFLHWGNIPMWDAKTVQQHPADPTQWRRLTVLDDGFDYGTDPNATVRKLHYRLDPAPFQDPVPAAVTDPTLAAQLAAVAPHFTEARALFQDVYNFATTEYTDANSALGPLPPTAPAEVQTPIDSHQAHFVLFPDYAHPNPPTNPQGGRQAHNNHLHFQLGPTGFSGPRTT
jgi:hypothetical protein